MAFLMLLATVYIYRLGLMVAVEVPNLEYKVYEQDGDILIGALISVQSPSESEYCAPNIRTKDNPQMAEMVNFAIKQVNERSDLLPNISLGFAVMDTCGTDVTSLARATFFVDIPSCADDNETESYEEHGRHFKIAGVVGPQNSRDAVMVSGYLGLYQIPTLGLFSTSDELSDKQRYEYFSRLVPADEYQVIMFMDLLTMNNWTYVSLLFAEGSYGENAAKKVEYAAEDHGVCIAYQKRIPLTDDLSVYDLAARGLAQNLKARVVIMFLTLPQVAPLFNALSNHGLLGRFIWLCGDSLAYLSEYIPEVSGAIFSSGVMEPVPEFNDYYGSLAPWDVPANPWIHEGWAAEFNCFWGQSHDNTEQVSCNEFEQFFDSPNLNILSMTSKVYEGVLVYALALHNLINDTCPDAFLLKWKLAQCVQGPVLLQYIREVSLEPYGRPIQFDSVGNVRPVFDVKQMFFDANGRPESVKIGRWDAWAGRMLLEKSINYSGIVGFSTREDPNQVPESVCSKPCGVKEYAVLMEVHCCWECRTCRDNEIISDNSGRQSQFGDALSGSTDVKSTNRTSCEACPKFMWPDDSQKRCEVIELTYMTVQDAYGITLASLTSLGILLCMPSGILFIHFRTHKLVKASSRELMVVTFLGVILAFVGVFSFILRPSSVTCWLRVAAFCLAVNIIFSPILVKSIRIYRIFSAGKKGNTPPRFISSLVQVGLTSMIVGIQVLLLILGQVDMQPRALRNMPVELDKYVELLCEQSLTGFLLPMVYNILIIVICALLGFLTRKLPENFNESWFIFISVSTTLFAWLIFVPSYYNAFYAFHKEALLALCLLLNAYITLGCLFLPKLYAVLFVKETKMKLSIETKVTTILVTSQSHRQSVE